MVVKKPAKADKLPPRMTESKVDSLSIIGPQPQSERALGETTLFPGPTLPSDGTADGAVASVDYPQPDFCTSGGESGLVTDQPGSLLHGDRDTADGPEIEIQTLGTRVQGHDHAILILQPQSAHPAAEGDTRIQLGVGARKLGNFL